MNPKKDTAQQSKAATGAKAVSLPAWKVILSIIQFRPWYWLVDLISVILIRTVMQLVPGLIIRAFLDMLSGNAQVGLNIWTLMALFASTFLLRAAGSYGFYYADVPIFSEAAFLLRKNLLKHILLRPGATPLPDSPGEAVSRFRNDVMEIPTFVLWFNDILSGLGAAVISIGLMISISAPVTLIALTPVVLVGFVANAATRRASRQATGKVTGFIGEFFGAIQVVKVAAAEQHVIDHFAELNEERRKLSLRERLFSEILNSIYRNTGSLGTGVILLLVGQAMRSGSFNIGDFSLFVYLLQNLGDMTTYFGMIAARYKQLNVSIERMYRLMQDAPREALIQTSPVNLEGPLPEVVYAPRTASDRLETITAQGLSYQYPGSENGIKDINLQIKRGSFTVVTGRVGSGKTTLLRALLGLLPKDNGAICWNGQEVANAGAFFIPPRSAYTAQVPRLFSTTLRSNIMLGLEKPEDEIMNAVRLAVLEHDLQGLEKGLDTPVGPTGGSRAHVGAPTRAAGFR